MARTRVTKREFTLKDISTMPTEGVVLGLSADDLSGRPKMLKLKKSAKVDGKTVYLLDEKKALGVVKFGNRKIVTSSRGTSVDKGVPCTLVEKFEPALPATYASGNSGLVSDIIVKFPADRPFEESSEKPEEVESPTPALEPEPVLEKPEDRSFSREDALKVARSAANKESATDGDLAGEGGVHQHHLARQDSATRKDGAHQHLFLLPDGSLVATDLDGEHQHSLKEPASDVSEAGISAHSHRVSLGNGATSTREGGEHMHVNQVAVTAIDGFHQHELELPDGSVVMSMTPGEFWELTQGGEDVSLRLSGMSDKVEKLMSAVEGLTLRAPALSLVDVDGDGITIQVHGAVDQSIRRTIESELAKRVPAEYKLKVISDEFGATVHDNVPLATFAIQFATEPAVQVSKEYETALLDMPYGDQRASLQYQFTEQGMSLAFRLQSDDATVSWVTDAARPQVSHKSVTSLASTADIVNAADYDGSRYQRPVRGVPSAASVHVQKGHLLLDHEGSVATSASTTTCATIEKLTASYGIQVPGYHEYLLSGDSRFAGILVAKSQVDIAGASSWTIEVKKECLPTVLTQAAVDGGLMPPLGRSGMTTSLERETPAHLQYWRASTAKAAQQIRDDLVKTQYFTSENILIVDGEFRRVQAKVSYEIAKSLPNPVPEGTPPATPGDRKDPVRKVAELLPDSGADVCLFDRFLSEDMTPADVVDAVSILDGKDYLVAYPDTPASRMELSKVGRLFKLDGHSDTVFATSSPFRSVAGISWIAEPAQLWQDVASDEVVSLLKRMGARSVPIFKAKEERFVYGVVLEPETVDAQNDIYSAEEIRDAAHLYMAEFAHIKLMHKGEFIDSKVSILESYVAPHSFEIDGNPVKKGTWLMGVRVHDDKLWKSIQSGELTGFSIGGTAIKTPVSSMA